MLHAGHGVVGMGHEQDIGAAHHDKFQRNLTVGTVGRNDRPGRINPQLALHDDVGRLDLDGLARRGGCKKVQKTLDVDAAPQVDD